MFDNDTPALTQAITIWTAGRNISLVLFARLMDEGYDVPALQRVYKR